MSKEMLMNVSEGEECRIALVEDGRLEELYMERTSSTSHVGNVYKGRVSNVEPSIQAAFIDFGFGRNGFLHISDLMPSYFGEKGEDVQESVGRKMSRRDRPPIQRCLRRGDDIVVQIIKEGIGTKGPTLSTYLSIPGRILVMMPGMAKMGVSRKIEDEQERRRLRQILDSLEPPKDAGFIIRTAGVGKTKLEIQRDFTYLTRLWQTFVKKRDSGPGPTELYTEGDLVSRTVRDVFTSDVERIVVDNKDVAKRVKDVIKLANPRARNKVELYEEAVPLFHKYGIEAQIEQMHSRHVPLPSGGSLVIDSTEAVVAIDVNSGKFREHNDAEMTAFKTDMEAAEEIPRQLRLRDLGGVIICDFIDLRFERHRRELEDRLHRNFENDRAKTRVLRMSQFGIIEITRQRMRPSLKRSIYFDCPHCKGAGLVKTPESMSLDAMRRLAIAINDARVARVEMSICPDVALALQNRKRRAISELELRFNKRINIKSDQTLAMDDVKLELFDTRDSLVYLAELGMAPQLPAGELRPGQPPQQRSGRGGGRGDGRHQQGGRGDGRRRDGRDDRGRGQGGQGGQDQRRQEPSRRREEEEEDPHSIDRVEQEVEEREEEIEREPDSALLPPLPEQQARSQAEQPAMDESDVEGEEGEEGEGEIEPSLRGDSAGAESGRAAPAVEDSRDDESGEEDMGHEPTPGNYRNDAAQGPGGSQDRGGEGDGGPRRRRRRRGRGRGGAPNDDGRTGGFNSPPPFEAGPGRDAEPDIVEGHLPPPPRNLPPRDLPRQPQREPQRPPQREPQRDMRRDSRDDRGRNQPQPRGYRDDRGPRDNRDHRDNRNLPPQRQVVNERYENEYDLGEDDAAPDQGGPPLPAQGKGPANIPGRPGPGPGPGNGPGGGPANAGAVTGDADGGPRRRRRRRGGRGRGRNRGRDIQGEGLNQGGPSEGSMEDEARDNEPMDETPVGELPPPPQEPAVEERHADEAHVETPVMELRRAPEPEIEPMKAEEPEKPAKPEKAAKAAKAPRKRAPAKPRKKASSAAAEEKAEAKSEVKTEVKPQPIVRTGSADRHLASDEPIAPQPAFRPRSVVDLDHIPDDFD